MNPNKESPCSIYQPLNCSSAVYESDHGCYVDVEVNGGSLLLSYSFEGYAIIVLVVQGDVSQEVGLSVVRSIADNVANRVGKEMAVDEE